MLVATIAILAFIVDAPRDAQDLLLRIVLSAVLVVSFRIWDDLADRNYDRVHHPTRVLVHSAAVGGFWTLILGLAAISACALAAFSGAQSLRIYVGLIVVLGVLYHGPKQLRDDRFAHAQLVLLKYPVFIALLTAQVFSSQSVLAGALAYLLISVYEWRDDPAFRERYLGGRIGVVFVIGLITAVSLVNIYG